ncbi:MAG: hypothetical protein ACYDC2_00160 [Solirubrobacteraceae bacterium]
MSSSIEDPRPTPPVRLGGMPIALPEIITGMALNSFIGFGCVEASPALSLIPGGRAGRAVGPAAPAATVP